MENTTYPAQLDSLRNHIEHDDAILVRAASGMSAAAGFRHYYERDEMFVHELGAFESKYGFHCSFDGYDYPFPSSEERWGYIARSGLMTLTAETGEPYVDMKSILADKNFHILTTNQDTQFTRVSPEEKISAIRGNFRYLQCSRCCHDQLYPAQDLYAELVSATDADLKIPKDMVPRCPECGAELEPWVRSQVFLEGSKYREEYAKVNTFLEAYAGRRILLWEIGVGRMTPMFIREPFWNLHTICRMRIIWP